MPPAGCADPGTLPAGTARRLGRPPFWRSGARVSARPSDSQPRTSSPAMPKTITTGARGIGDPPKQGLEHPAGERRRHRQAGHAPAQRPDPGLPGPDSVNPWIPRAPQPGNRLPPRRWRQDTAPSPREVPRARRHPPRDRIPGAMRQRRVPAPAATGGGQPRRACPAVPGERKLPFPCNGGQLCGARSVHRRSSGLLLPASESLAEEGWGGIDRNHGPGHGTRARPRWKYHDPTWY